MLSFFRKGGAAQLIVGGVVFAIIIVFVLEFRAGRGPAASLKQNCGVEVQDRCISVKDFYAAYGLIVPPGLSSRKVRTLGLRKVIANGLVEGGVEGAVTIHDWATWAGPFGWFIHLTNHRRNRIEGFRLARRIIKDQKTHPGCSIFLVAHSGGAGIALLAVEALSPAMPIDGVILLAGAVSPRRDLCAAMERTKLGIWNFSSHRDIGFLVLGTSLFGTMDRTYGPSAGAVGFKIPDDLSETEAQCYAKKLHSMPYDSAMAEYGNYGTHNGWAKRKFVAAWLAPIIKGDPMPSLAPSDDAEQHDDDAQPADSPER